MVDRSGEDDGVRVPDEPRPTEIDVAYRWRVGGIVDGHPGLVLLNRRRGARIRRHRICGGNGEGGTGAQGRDADVQTVAVVEGIKVEVGEVDSAGLVDRHGGVAVGKPEIAVTRGQKVEGRIERNVALGPGRSVVARDYPLRCVVAATREVAHDRHERGRVVRIDRDVLFGFGGRRRRCDGRKASVRCAGERRGGPAAASRPI